jgi:hypothetical protein
MNGMGKKSFYGSLSLFMTSMVLATSAMGLSFGPDLGVQICEEG